jgi:hypothetical protein
MLTPFGYQKHLGGCRNIAWRLARRYRSNYAHASSPTSGKNEAMDVSAGTVSQPELAYRRCRIRHSILVNFRGEKEAAVITDAPR